MVQKGRRLPLLAIGLAAGLIVAGLTVPPGADRRTSAGAAVGSVSLTPLPRAAVATPSPSRSATAARPTGPPSARANALARPGAAGVRPPTGPAPAAGVRVAGATAAETGPRQFTFVNATAQTIWVAGWQQTAQPALSTSFAEEPTDATEATEVTLRRDPR